MARPQNHEPTHLPRRVALQLAKLAKVPKNYREEFCQDISDHTLTIWKTNRHALLDKLALIETAKAARSLNQKFLRMNKQDREWINKHIEHFQLPLIGGEIQNLALTVDNIAVVFSQAAGRPAPDHALKPFGRRLKVKDQVLSQLVFQLCRLAEELGGEFTFDKNSRARHRGTLLQALELLRDHLPRCLIPKALPLGTIQKIKSDFSQREWKLNRTATPEHYVRLQKKWPHLTLRECIRRLADAN
jgi:hypothetical protein